MFTCHGISVCSASLSLYSQTAALLRLAHMHRSHTPSHDRTLRHIGNLHSIPDLLDLCLLLFELFKRIILQTEGGGHRDKSRKDGVAGSRISGRIIELVAMIGGEESSSQRQNILAGGLKMIDLHAVVPAHLAYLSKRVEVRTCGKHVVLLS